MADEQRYGDQARLLLMPELRMVGLDYGALPFDQTGEVVIDRPGRACFYSVKHGRALLTIDGETTGGLLLTAGDSVGLEDGGSHRWTCVTASASDAHLPSADARCEVFGGSVDRRHTVLQRTRNQVLVLPADAEPHASIVRHCVAVLELDRTTPRRDDAIGRRCAEIIQLEMLQYAQAQLRHVGSIPASVRQDAPLLRAWTAFLSDPSRPWTVASLAEVACISRTAFAARFGRLTGAPPLATLRWLRIRYAADMLRSTRAPLAEIARTVGYGSDVALLRAFRREMGMTPSQFRSAGEAASKGDAVD